MSIDTTDSGASLVEKAVPPRFFALLAGLVLLVYAESLVGLFSQWWVSEEYGHGLFMPFIAAYIVWQQRGDIFNKPLKSSMSGFYLIFFSLTVLIAATLADLESVKHYSFTLSLAGLVLLFGGWHLLRACLVPIALIVLVIPLPYLLISSLTAGLQLISSELGTWLLRLFGIPVFLEGNIIDMGVYQLQVVEACSGLRYLYPLLSISLLVVYFLRSPMWLKVVLMLSTVPVTIFMNSLRIAITGVLVNAHGTSVAEGFLHDFEGWVVFLAALACLVAEVWLYKLLIRHPGSLSDLFAFDGPNVPEDLALKTTLRFPIYLLSVVVVLFTGAVVFFINTSREAYIPDREPFSTFPMRIDNKNVSLSYLESDVLNILRPDDYFLGSYAKTGEEPVSLYMVYYSQQHEGSALHSPRVCIPGGGWIIDEESVAEFQLRGIAQKQAVNRVVIRKGEYTQLVYYWIDQMGTTFTNEYLARASLLKSAVLDNRSDGALVRVNVMVENDNFEKADKQLQTFIAGMSVYLRDHLPE